MEARKTEMNRQLKIIVQAEVPEGTSKRIVCLACGGGYHKEKSLSLTYDAGKILYRCFRDSCRESGIIIMRSATLSTRLTPSELKTDLFDKETVELTSLDYDLLREKYGLEKKLLRGVKMSVQDQRFLLPIRGPWGELRGIVARSFFLSPKVVNYRYKSHVPFIGWFMPYEFRDKQDFPTVLVEDWFSACKVSQAGYWAVCLNGTHIPYPAAVEIAKEASKDEIIIALDPGALTTAVKHYTMYSGMWENSRVVSLKRDLKYLTEEEIKHVITSGEKVAVSSADQPPDVRGAVQPNSS